MASTNAGSMTNAQGEFKPTVPRDEPLQTSGHQPGQLVGNDAAPEFSAKVLPAGSAPTSKSFQPNPIDEVPGQANNPFAEQLPDRQEDVKSDALDFPGATSGDVHQGIGKPMGGQTSAEMANDGKTHRARERQGLEGPGAGAGSGLTGGESHEARRLQEEHTETGPIPARVHNTSLTGAEGLDPTSAENLASEERKVMQGDYLRRGEKGSGNAETKQ